MLNLILNTVSLLVILLLLQTQSSFADICDMDSSMSPTSRPTIDTVKAIVIYCAGKNVTTSLPTWKDAIWNGANQFSVPRFYSENSNNLYILTADIAKEPGKSTKLYKSTCCDPIGETGGPDFDLNIVTLVDQDVNFALYDQDNDNYLDAFFLFIIDHPTLPVGGVPFTNVGYYTTNDINPNTGQAVVINGYDGVTCRSQRTSTQGYGVHVSAHEYGHKLCLPDLYLPNPRGVGGFSIMSDARWNDVPPPFDPWSKEQLGWVTPTVVENPLWNKVLKDFNTRQEAYKFPRNSNEYFLLSRHWGNKNLDSASFWERNFPGGGVLIEHVDKSLGNCSINNSTNVFHKLLDIENSHGLYDWAGTPLAPTTPNDSAGRDSMDIQSTNYVGSATSFYNSTTKTHFDAATNPSSDGYYNHLTLGWIQNQQTNIAVRDIQGDGTGNMYANLFKSDNVYGVITGPLSFSKTSYTIKGDLTINSGASLTINSGAKIQFTPNSDNQSSGVDVNKGEIIVNGTLVVNGTSTDTVVITSNTPQPADTNWYGIRVLSGGSAKIKYAQIKHAYIGASYENSAIDTVSNCLFDSNYVYGIKAFNNNLVIRNSSIKNIPVGMGIYSNTYSPKIENNYFDNLKYGVIVSGAAAVVTGNKFVGTSISERAISCEGGSSATVSSDTVQGNFNNTYIESYKSYPVISNCVLGFGDTVLSHAPVGVKAVISSLGSTPTKVRNSNIWGYTSKGIYGAGGKIDVGSFAEADPGYNNIHTSASGTKSVWNTSSTTLMAETNWWGQAPPPSSLFQGTVDRTPYLLDSTEAGPAKLLPFKLPISDNLPKSYAVSQNYPNPFNPTTVIEYSIPVSSKVSVKVYNILGQQVKKLFEGEKLAGTYTVEWDGTNQSGKKVSSGIYLYLIEAGQFKETKKMTLIR